VQKPFVLPYRSLKGATSLKGLQAGRNISASEVKNLSKLLSEDPMTAPIAEKMLAQPDKAREILQASMGALPPETTSRMVHSLQGQASSALTSLGLSGLIGGGAAGLQYGKGRRAGAVMTPEQRHQITGVQT
jgi:hypothetical protein